MTDAASKTTSGKQQKTVKTVLKATYPIGDTVFFFRWGNNSSGTALLGCLF